MIYVFCSFFSIDHNINIVSNNISMVRSNNVAYLGNMF